MQKISVIAFDIDGTLYSSSLFTLRIIPYFLRHLPFYLKYNKVRKILHKTAPLPDFYEYQARLLGDLLKCTPKEAKALVNSIVYEGLRPYFEATKPFRHLDEVFKKLKDSGYKLALLSDFPPSQKGEIWGVKKYCDLILGTEELGALKPSKYPFGIMAKKLGVEPENVLYVGNSVKYDVLGAKNAGMKTAYIMPLWRKILHIPLKLADINFFYYRQLADIMLK